MTAADSPARVGLIWWSMPVVLVAVVLVLWFSPLHGVADNQRVLGFAMVFLAAATAVRAALAPDGGRLAAAAAAAGVAGAAAIVVTELPPGRSQLLTGAFWTVLGLGELMSKMDRRGRLATPVPLAVVFLLAGVVTATFPVAGELDYAILLAAVSAAVAIALLAHAVWRVVAGKRRRPARRGWRTTGVVLEVAAVVAVVAGYGSVTGAVGHRAAYQRSITAFYETPVDAPAGEPGALIRSEPLRWAGIHGLAWRVLYWSQDRFGRPTVSSGSVFAPSGAGHDRRVLDLAHGTVGFDAECAPSRQEAAAGDLAPGTLNAALDRGWVVTATDYAGAAGTAGRDGFEAYLIQVAQARDALNIARAARLLPASGAGTTVGIAGGSQGGGTALEAANIAPSYAPELTVVGVAAAAPAADIGLTLDHLNARDQAFSWPLGSMLVAAYLRGYPDLPLEGVLTDQGRDWLTTASRSFCTAAIGSSLARAARFAQAGPFFAENPENDPRWREALDQNRVTALPRGVPAYLLHGLADVVVAPEVSATTIRRFCAAGTPTTVTWIPGAGHVEVATLQDPAGAVLGWLADRFDGRAPANDCGAPMPVQPAAGN